MCALPAPLTRPPSSDSSDSGDRRLLSHPSLRHSTSIRRAKSAALYTLALVRSCSLESHSPSQGGSRGGAGEAGSSPQ